MKEGIDIGRLKKCVCCGESIQPEEPCVPYKNRYAHEKCFNIAMKTLQQDKQKELNEKKTKGRKAKPKIELKDKLSEEEYKDKQQYYDYIREILGEEKIPTVIYAISEDYIKKYNFSFKGMHQTLVYVREVLKKELSGNIVGIIRYYYDDAAMLNKKIEEVEKLNADVDINQMYSQRTIKISPKQRNRNNEINITSIGAGHHE